MCLAKAFTYLPTSDLRGRQEYKRATHAWVKLSTRRAGRTVLLPCTTYSTEAAGETSPEPLVAMNAAMCSLLTSSMVDGMGPKVSGSTPTTELRFQVNDLPLPKRS